MEKNKQNEELVKEKIFSVFSNSLNEPLRQQVYLGQLSSLIFNWCRDYLNFDINDMGVEIVVITKRLLKDKGNSNISHDKDSFMKYLFSSLKTGKKEYKRSNRKSNYADIIHMKESYIGKKLTKDERVSSINKWYDYENAIKIVGTSLAGAKIDRNPQTDHLNSTDTAIILEAIKTVLSKKQERSRDCYKALLTLHCFDNINLYPALDSQIIEAYRQNSEKPKQYEIYQKYHPEASKGSSEAMASTNLKNILSDLERYLEEKNPEIFH